MVNLYWTFKTTNTLGGRQVRRLSTPSCGVCHAKTYGAGKTGNYPLHGRRQAAAGQVPFPAL